MVPETLVVDKGIEPLPHGGTALHVRTRSTQVVRNVLITRCVLIR